MSDVAIVLILLIGSIVAIALGFLVVYLIEIKHQKALTEFKLKEDEIDKTVDTTSLSDLVKQSNESSGSDPKTK